ncbi:hypothetical protein BDZ45DRAFT_674890 [Acephala macrosclerotiorum]|nr:hypothetical protein BDZ45DRAFT_674890 [Acephala macrosclerotiorum]
MMDSPDPELSISTVQFDELQEEKKRAEKEIRRLQSLLAKNNIDYRKKSEKPTYNSPDTRKFFGGKDIRDKTESIHGKEIPNEILLRILSFAVTSSATLTDPFYKGRRDTMTKEENLARREINVNFLATSKFFNVEGTRLLLENNEIVFTQAPALANFAKIPRALRSAIQHVTLRVVGRYYGERARKGIDLSGDAPYNSSLSNFTIPLLAQPDGIKRDGGIQAYCYTQLLDFLKAFRMPQHRVSGKQNKLLPSLKTMRLDLVNFCEHLPPGDLILAPVLRWHLGQFLDELLVTGTVWYEIDDTAHVLRNIVKDGGLFSEASAVFISVKDGLKILPGHGINHHLVRPQRVPMAQFWESHPDGGNTPGSNSLEGGTVFKWAFKELSDTKKMWIEFDYETGDQYYYDSDEMGDDEMDDSAMYDSEGNAIDSDEDDEDDEDEFDDSEDSFSGVPIPSSFEPPATANLEMVGLAVSREAGHLVLESDDDQPKTQKAAADDPGIDI